MDRKELEDQLEAFFEHNPLDDDMLYLKQFVKEHPDNKMGWYLLGKEYAVRDKSGKAKYCFAQAGEVYEAFEKKKIKLSLMDELKASQAVLPGQEGRHKRLKLGMRAALALLFAVILGSLLAGEQERAVAPWIAEGPIQGEEGLQEEGSRELESGLRILYTNPLLGQREEDGLWKKLAQSAKVTRGRTLLVEGYPTSDGKWVNGLRAPALLMSGTVTAGGNEMQVAYYKKEYCNCAPQSDPEAEQSVRAWMAGQEQDVIMRSLVKAYQSRFGEKLPETIDGLTRDFPNNLLPGFTEEMRQAYERLLKEKQAATATAAGSPGDGAQIPASAGTTAAAGSTLYPEPLEIIIDRKNYRLALVSGSIILRSYPVGLGGPRTPEGVYRISDKVKNPNGRDDGDFGSRGMQLSDTDYAIHGTNEPSSIGQDRSLGCVRMLKADVEELFDMAPAGTKVTIGSGLLPEDIIRAEKPLRLPSLRQETNPGKIYRWL